MKTITTDSMNSLLSWSYNAVLNGNPASKPIEQLVANYLTKHPDPEVAINSLVHYQESKAATSGFLTGFGGFTTMPVTVPADIATTIYVQMRMVAAIALIRGYDLHDDQVQTFVYACIAGQSVNDVARAAGIKIATRTTTNMIQRIPGKALTAINQKVGMQLITKFGQKGIFNLGKAVPVVGAVLGAGIDAASTKVIASAAKRTFLANKSATTTADLVLDATTQVFDPQDDDPAK